MTNRLEIRKARLTPVVVCHDEWPWPEVLVATEVSPRGMYLTAEDRVLQAGEAVRVSFRLGTPERWEIDAIVAHAALRRRHADDGYTGMGIEFVGASPIARLTMRKLLRGVPPPLPPGVARPRSPAAARRRPGRQGGRRATDPLRPESRWGRAIVSVGGPALVRPRLVF
jgi:hypothetical protein